MDALAHPFFDPAARRRQGGRQLEQGSLQLVIHAQLCQRRRDAKHEQGAHLVPVQPGERRAVAVEQRTAAARSALGIDRDTRHAEGIQVAVDSPDRNLQFLGQFLGRHPSPSLEEHHDRQQAVCAHPALPLNRAIYLILP